MEGCEKVVERGRGGGVWCEETGRCERAGVREAEVPVMNVLYIPECLLTLRW